MTSVPMRTLFGYECRRVLRAPVVWAVLALLLVAGSVGAVNTARLHGRQADDVAGMVQQESEWYDDVRARAVRYAQPSSTELPYWQDPTDAAGFSRYFLRRFAAKPHLPLSPLAVGHSDLQPFAVPLRLETLFGGDRVYDFQPPRALATGRFDLSFVLTFILPLGLGVAAAAVGAQERDEGILSLIAAQPVSPRHWWTARVCALGTVLVPGVASAVFVALVASGAPVVRALPETMAALSLAIAYTLFWLAIAGWCVARGHGIVASASTVAGVWLLLTVACPLAATLVSRSLVPSSSAVADVDELRRTTNAVQAQGDAIVARRLTKHLGPNAPAFDPAALDYSTRLFLITEEMEERLAAQDARRQASRATVAAIARVMGWLSPSLALHVALADLAGTGTPRHAAFERQVRDFQLELRAFMRPYVFEPVRTPPRRTCRECPGRLTFVDYNAIPRFAMQDEPPARRVVAALGTAGWLTLLAAAIAVAGIGRGSRWALAS